MASSRLSVICFSEEPIALPCGLERLTERQQLALLLQVTKEESQGNSKYQDEEEADTSDSSSQESDDDSETSSDTSDSSDSSASSGDGADRPPDYDSWTTAKKRRWNTMDESPNGTNKFYYNFVPPGVTLRTGAWSSEEARLFMYMLQAHPPMDAWGLFSMNIPGRTGQQCEAYHRKLQKQGKLVQNDPPSSLPRLKVQSVTSQSPSSSSRSRRTPSKEDPSTPRHSDGTSADSSSRSASSANLKKRQYTTPNAKDGPTMNLKSLMDSASDLPAATPPRGGNHHANSVNPDLTPDNPTQNNVTPKAPKGGRQAWKTRSRTEGHGGGMSPVKLVGMGEEGAKHKKSFQKVSTMETTEEDSLDAEESCHRPRKAKMVSKYASRHRSLAPTVPQSNDRSPSTPPFSSAILPPLSKKAKTTHIVGGGFDMESARLKRAYEIQTARLKEACERQLDQIRLKYDADEDERPTSSSFSFLDGCKSLLMMRKWAYDEDGPSMFEMPGSKEQMMKQSVQDYEDAMV